MPVGVTVWASVYLTKLIDRICTRSVCLAPCDKARARLLLVQSKLLLIVLIQKVQGKVFL